MGLDPVSWVFLILQLAGDLSQLAILIWIVAGGWEFILRTLGFFLDLNLVNFIEAIYNYFMQILEGTLFNDAVVSELMQNVYVFIGIIMFFRLLMLVMKYLINPDLVSDAKLGVNSLIKRVVIGLMGILFIPTIFDMGLNLQSSILKDNLIQQIVIPGDMLKEVEDKVASGGRFIGNYVLAGFISPGENATNKTKKEYEAALEQGDFRGLSTLEKDGWLGGKYEYDYFYILSTFTLCYVLYIMVKYALDVLTRFFRLLLYQMLAPVAMIEYMINGSDDGVFKAWKQGVLGTYFMLFVRVMAIWFVIFVLALMAEDSKYSAGSLLAVDDYLLRALIIIALLGFMLDLPKLVGQVFGLDLEQEGNAGGILKQVGGMLKGAALGAVAMGGAAVGGAIGTGKAAFGATKAGKKWNESKKTFSEKNPGLSGVLGAQKAGMSGIFGAAINSNSITGGLAKGYSGVRQNQKQQEDKAKADAAKREQEQLDRDRHAEITSNQEKQKQLAKNQVVMELAARLIESDMKLTPQELAVRMFPEAFNGNMAANITGTMNAEAATLKASDIDSSGKVTGTAKDEMIQTVTQRIKQECDASGIDVPAVEIEARAKTIVEAATFDVPTTKGDPITMTVDANVVTSCTGDLAVSDQTITQTINQVQGTTISGRVVDAVQTVNQQLGQVVDNTATTASAVTQQVDILRDIRTNTEETAVWSELAAEDLEQQITIQRDIRTNTSETAVWGEVTAENTESIDRKTGGNN